jgi:hypothetical protein
LYGSSLVQRYPKLLKLFEDLRNPLRLLLAYIAEFANSNIQQAVLLLLKTLRPGNLRTHKFLLTDGELQGSVGFLWQRGKAVLQRAPLQLLAHDKWTTNAGRRSRTARCRTLSVPPGRRGRGPRTWE